MSSLSASVEIPYPFLEDSMAFALKHGAIFGICLAGQEDLVKF